MTRDCLFYGLSILGIMFIFLDGQVNYLEALAVIAFYAVYIIMMYFNDRIEKWVKSKLQSEPKRDSSHQVNVFFIRFCVKLAEKPAESAEAHDSPVFDSKFELVSDSNQTRLKRQLDPFWHWH